MARFLKVLSVLLLVWLIYLSVTWAVSDYYFSRAKDQFNAIDFNQQRYARILNSPMAEVEKALQWRPSNTEAIDFKGDLLYRMWWLSPDGQYLMDSNLLKKAKQMHIKALSTRKNWPFTMARLALIYSHQPQLDENFNIWFSKSFDFGRYETQIARSMMRVGLENWLQLTSQQQTQTVEFIRLSIEQKVNQTRDIKQMLINFDKLQYVCSKLPISIRMQEVCGKK